jgi:pre-mRNA cleavage complex 2 protein Pcf11
MVEDGVSQEELQQILIQLRAMGRETASSVPLLPPAPLQQRPVVSSMGPYATSAPTHSVIAQGGAAISGNNPVSSISSSSTPTPSALPSVSGISNLFQSLVKAGLVSANATPTGAGLSTDTPPRVAGTPDEARVRIDKDSEGERLQAQRDYAQIILGMKMRLSTTDITKCAEILVMIVTNITFFFAMF